MGKPRHLIQVKDKDVIPFKIDGEKLFDVSISFPTTYERGNVISKMLVEVPLNLTVKSNSNDFETTCVKSHKSNSEEIFLSKINLFIKNLTTFIIEKLRNLNFLAKKNLINENVEFLYKTQVYH